MLRYLGFAIALILTHLIRELAWNEPKMCVASEP